MTEKRKINIIIWYFIVIITAALCVVCTGLVIVGIVELNTYFNTYFNPEQEIVKERFTQEYCGTLYVYHN